MAFDATARTAELEELYLSDEGGWRAIKAIADPLGIVKPETGWDDAIPLITEAEKNAAPAPEPSSKESSSSEAPASLGGTPWRKVRTDLYGNVIPSPWSS